MARDSEVAVMVADRTSLVRRMQRTLQGADSFDEHAVQMVEQLQERVRGLRSLGDQFGVVRLSSHVTERISSVPALVAGVW